MRLVVAFARMALLAFPRRFRREHGRDLFSTFVADLKQSEGRGQWVRGVAGAWDLVRAGLAERSKLTGRLRSDVWQAWRSVAVRPGASIGTIVIFSLGVGLLSAMFALTDPFILRPLPYARAHELVAIQVGRNKRDARVPTFDEWRSQTQLFSGLALFAHDYGPPVSVEGRWVTLDALKVTGNFFEVLGVPGPGERDWHAAWRDRDAPVMLAPAARTRGLATAMRPGERLARKQGPSLRVLGILPDRFTYPSTTGQPDALTFFAEPQLSSATYFGRGTNTGVSTTRPPTVIARLQPGVTLETVRGTLLNRDSFDGLNVLALSDWLTRDLWSIAWGAFAAGVLVLLVCAGNIANIFVARGTYRLREFATREALGASRGDILRLWMVELLVVTCIAVVLGLAIAWTAIRVVSTVIPEQYVVLGAPAVTYRVELFALCVGLLVAATGFLPALVITRVASSAVSGRTSATESRKVRTMRVLFASSQSALAVVLAIGAGMLVQSFLNLIGQEKGYDAATLYVAVDGFNGERAHARDIPTAIDALQRIPGAAAVAATSGRVIGETWFSRGVGIDGVTVTVDILPVSDRYFEASGLGILRGRALVAADGGLKGAVVNEAFAKKHWPSGSAIGHDLMFGPQGTPIVGVTRNALDQGLAAAPTPSVYVALAGSGFSSGVRFLIRRADGREIPADQIRAAILSVNPNADVGDVKTIGARLMETVRERTFSMMVLTFFGLAGGAVTVAGLVGIVSFVVARRTREIAIRTAIGAKPSDIRRLVVREAVGAAVGGGVVGLLIGRWLSTWLESLVFGVEAGSWTTAVAAVVASLAVMIGAALIPARRAVKLQPSEALRVD